MGRYFVYIFYLPTGEPFYIGCGSGNRIKAHASAAKHGYPYGTASKIREIWASGGEYTSKKVFESDDRLEALAEEARLIAKHRGPNLINRSPGVLPRDDGMRLVSTEITQHALEILKQEARREHRTAKAQIKVILERHADRVERKVASAEPVEVLAQ